MADTPSDPTPSTPDAAPVAPEKSADSLLTSTSEAKTEPVTPPTKVEPVAPVVPEKYELTGEKLDPAALDAMTPVFKELGLTQESAQKLASTFSEYAMKATQKQEADFSAWLDKEKQVNAEAIRKEWGAQYEPNLASARAAYAKFGDADAKKLLDETGLGTHPSFLKMFAAIGKLIQEDNPPANTKTPSGRKADAEVFYGTH